KNVLHRRVWLFTYPSQRKIGTITQDYRKTSDQSNTWFIKPYFFSTSREYHE
ncbi:MAG: hypothetical protein ACI9GE_000265, partial [Oceanospirillaceae bacterium]